MMRRFFWVSKGVLRLLTTSMVVGLLVTLVACGDDGGSANANLLQNPGFEAGAEPWFSMETSGWGEAFEVTDDLAHSGSHSALLKLRPGAEAAQHRVFGAVQTLTSLPEWVSGYYRVEGWQKGTPLQYLQFVVIAIPENASANVQIRYLLAGTDVEPFSIGNARFVFVGEDEPVTGQWVHFERDVAADFQQFWNGVPEGLKEVRVFFEARYDSETAVRPLVAGDVYYDDLYAGPKPD